MATVRVKVKSPVFYHNIKYKAGSELDIESDVYQSHKDVYESIQFKKIVKTKNDGEGEGTEIETETEKQKEKEK